MAEQAFHSDRIASNLRQEWLPVNRCRLSPFWVPFQNSFDFTHPSLTGERELEGVINTLQVDKLSQPAAYYRRRAQALKNLALWVLLCNAPRYSGHKPTVIIEGITVQIQFGQLLNLPDIQVLNVEITELEMFDSAEHSISSDGRCLLHWAYYISTLTSSINSFRFDLALYSRPDMALSGFEEVSVEAYKLMTKADYVL